MYKEGESHLQMCNTPLPGTLHKSYWDALAFLKIPTDAVRSFDLEMPGIEYSTFGKQTTKTDVVLMNIDSFLK